VFEKPGDSFDLDSLKSFLRDLRLPRSIRGWIHTPFTYEGDWEKKAFGERDDIWHDEEIFSGEEILIESITEWYSSPNVVTIYTDHKYLLNQNLGMGKPHEQFYYQNVDDGDFESEMHVDEGLPSGQGRLKIQTVLSTKSPPSGENNFAMMDYSSELYVVYDSISSIQGIKFLPRLIAYPLNSMFRYYYVNYIGEEQVNYDIEYARERFNEYFQYIRKYHGEEPAQSRSRQSDFVPAHQETFFD